MFADRLIDAIAEKGSPICVGIDPIFELLPDEVAGPADQRGACDVEAAVAAIFQFSADVLRIVAPHVPCVKFQSAYFEKYLWQGVRAYYRLIHEAKQLGLLVIGDVKRGDIGATSAAYAAAHLSQSPYAPNDADTPDAITINPMLGLDTLEPFTQVAEEMGKGLFMLVRTSNPGSAQFQDAKLVDGRTWSEALADALAPIAASEGLIGQSGYSALGAVVGATQPQTMHSLRKRLPKSIFLLPGYGTQGATAEMARAAFDDHSRGAIISASRSILYAHRNDKYAGASDWRKALASAVVDMRRDVGKVLA